MKKFVIGQCIWLVITAALVGAIAYPEGGGFRNVAAVLLWTYTILMLLAVLYAASLMNKSLTGTPDEKAKAIADIRKFLAENPEWGMLRKTFSWVQRLATVCLAAYTGLVVAAPVYLLVVWLNSGAGAAFRANFEKVEAAEAARKADI